MRADAGAMMSNPSILKETRRIFKEEGFKAFWKGNGVTIVHRLPYSSVNFFAYEQYKMVSNHTIIKSEQLTGPHCMLLRLTIVS